MMCIPIVLWTAVPVPTRAVLGVVVSGSHFAGLRHEYLGVVGSVLAVPFSSLTSIYLHLVGLVFAHVYPTDPTPFGIPIASPLQGWAGDQRRPMWAGLFARQFLSFSKYFLLSTSGGSQPRG